MTIRPILISLSAAAMALACSDPSNNESQGTAGIPKVGDSYGDGTVTEVSGSGCYHVTVSYAPEWSCSPAQVAEAEAGPQSPAYEGPTPQTGDAAFRLATSSCEGLAALRRPYIKHVQQEMLSYNRWATLYEKCLSRTEMVYLDRFGETCTPDYPDYPNADAGAAGGMGGSGGASPGGAVEEGAEEYSTTNTQVEGVDEADFVKNNGSHVYVLSADGLHVIDAWPAPEAHEVAHLPLRGEPRRMFLAGDRLLVYSRLGYTNGTPPSAQGCTYGYDCRFESEGGQTLVQVFDVSDPSSPTHLRTYETSGGYVSSRRVGPSVYTVVHDYGITTPPGIDPDLGAGDPEALESEYEAKRAAADATIDALPPAFFLPWVREVDAQGATVAEIASCDRALSSAAANGDSFVSVVSLDIEDLGHPTRTLVAGKAGYVYASATGLYLANDGVDGTDDYYSYYASAESDFSTIHKFALDGLDARYVGSAAVPGHVLNQFSMDEFEGVLRVATTSGWVPDPNVSTSITTFGEVSGELKQLGELTGLAPTEDIRSVRFDGERGFVVTFKKTDPLFVIDLSSPSEPSVLGELKIPGYSTYMHPLDVNHLLAVGFDADDHGDFAYFDGIQIQILDVTDLTNPQLLHKTVIGTRGSGSEGLLNHLAFNYFAPKAMLALPMTICEGGDDGQFGDQMTFSGLMAFDVSLENGITEHGRMPFVDPATVNGSYSTCGQWWSSSTSNVKRSIFMDDYLMGISDSSFQVASLDAMGEVLQSIPLE